MIRNNIMQENNKNKYLNSLKSKKEALNPSTNKQIINKYLTSEYRWVRQAAATHPSIDKYKIKKLIKNGDKYILKGLYDNSNCNYELKNKINILLQNEIKYPAEFDEIKLKYMENEGETWIFIVEEVGSEISISKVIKSVLNGSDWEEYIRSQGDWKDCDEEWHAYGPTTLINTIIYPDGLVEKFEDFSNLYYDETEPQDGDDNLGTDHFFYFGSLYEKGHWRNYKLKLEYEFNPKYLKPIFNENSKSGIISYYEYNNKETNEHIQTEGDFEESRPSINHNINLYVNTDKGLTQIWDFDKLRNEMKEKNLDCTKKNDIKTFIIKKYNLKDVEINTEIKLSEEKINEYKWLLENINNLDWLESSNYESDDEELITEDGDYIFKSDLVEVLNEVIKNKTAMQDKDEKLIIDDWCYISWLDEFYILAKK